MNFVIICFQAQSLARGDIWTVPNFWKAETCSSNSRHPHPKVKEIIIHASRRIVVHSSSNICVSRTLGISLSWQCAIGTLKSKLFFFSWKYFWKWKGNFHKTFSEAIFIQYSLEFKLSNIQGKSIQIRWAWKGYPKPKRCFLDLWISAYSGSFLCGNWAKV